MNEIGPGANGYEMQGGLARIRANRIECETRTAMSRKLLTRTAQAPFGCEEIKKKHGEEGDESAGRPVAPKFSDEMRSDEQGPSNSGRFLTIRAPIGQQVKMFRQVRALHLT